jgi:hypothetical protein
MVFIPLVFVLRGFPVAAYFGVRLAENPCAALTSEKNLIYEWTLNRVSPYRGWTLTKFCVGTIYARS